LFSPDIATKSTVEEQVHSKSHETNSNHASKSNDNRESFKTLFSTADTELNRQNIVRFPTGCKRLDNLLDGGIEAGVITQIYGGPGVGKTQFCYPLCVMLPSHYSAIYIDTEGSFRPERIETIAKARGLDSKQILQKILVKKVLDSTQQESYTEAACCEINPNTDSNNKKKIKLLIVDSIINHYIAGRSKLPEKIQRLNKYMHLLLKTAHTSGVAVIVTNHQTQSSVDGIYNTVVPAGGNVMSYNSDYIIHLAGQNNNRRRARLELSPSNPQSDIYFVIDQQRGFTDIDEDKW
jgi:DNA repair protein RadA